MKLTRMRVRGFQSFGTVPTAIYLEPLTFFLGPNGAGKTAALHALARMFGTSPAIRRLEPSDFHTPITGPTAGVPVDTLWIEADFEFPELRDDDGTYATVPGHHGHMALTTADGVPRLRARLTAHLDADGEVDDTISYVTEVDQDDSPTNLVPMTRQQRAMIQVHYLPARRDPRDHISYAANALLGKLLRSAAWLGQATQVAGLAHQISDTLATNPGVQELGARLNDHWGALHKGPHFTTPKVSFEKSEVDDLLRHLTIGFTPGPAGATVDFSRLSDGQQSLLYVSLVLSVQQVNRKVLDGTCTDFDVDRLRPPVFTLLAVEEPENSLSPHYLGRMLEQLRLFSDHFDTQAAVATHSPALVRRVPPENIRYLRLDENRLTTVARITLPAHTDDAYKFVREAVLAYPELYFARLVVLGEGDSEEIVLPRILTANGLLTDQTSISIVPLGGRHVNHFWRLLHGLGIPYVTLLDLDLGRNQGGWGRLRYAAQQLLDLGVPSNLAPAHVAGIPAWDIASSPLGTEDFLTWLTFFRSQGVFFSTPLDLDYSMMSSFHAAFDIAADEFTPPDEAAVKAVLGKSHGPTAVYEAEQLEMFDAYRKRFKSRSKPAAHLTALSSLTDAELLAAAPEPFDQLVERIKTQLAGLPE